eukprot:snap_masked-scaffold_64-processed-gene-0.65-mRNA-1 protein AED:1.00 eAED:1.00 QI:0/0/0/0/1/1/3/0/92
MQIVNCPKYDLTKQIKWSKTLGKEKKRTRGEGSPEICVMPFKAPSIEKQFESSKGSGHFILQWFPQSHDDNYRPIEEELFCLPSGYSRPCAL